MAGYIGTTEEEALVARYRAALQFQGDRLRARVRNLSVEPNWIGGTDLFWYRSETPEGHAFLLVDPSQGTKEPAFDHAQVAALITQITGQPAVAEALPFDRIAFDSRDDGTPDLGSFRFPLDGQTWRCDLAAGVFEPADARLPSALGDFAWEGDIPGVNRGPVLPSPDGRWEIFAREHDLYLRDTASGQERRLTEDGEPDYAYGALSGTIWSGEVSMPRAGFDWPVQALWSPDSRFVATVRVDKRRVQEFYLQDSVADGDYTRRPVLYPYHCPLGGDPEIPWVELLVIEIESGRIVPVKAERLPGLYATIQGNHLRWTNDGSRLVYERMERGSRRKSLHVVDLATGEDREVLVETAETFVAPGQFDSDSRLVELIEGDSQVLWFSQRDGWGHLYRYDLESGALLGQVTSGAWTVIEILQADDQAGWVFFLAAGREPDRDLYYCRLYRCRYDGADLTLLTPEDAEHEVAFSPTGRFFVDRHSRVDLPTVSLLRAADGSLVMELERADIGELEAIGWRPPERFQGTADDSATPIYGVLYRPRDFEPSRSYPVIDHVYGGPQIIVAPRSFSGGLTGWAHAAATAEMGFVTVNIDGRGTPGRSKHFHDAGEGFTDGCGLIDHIAVLRQLAERYPYIDLERVGITGFSGGGYTSTRALLKYPEFYTVAVSGAGSHNQYIVGTSWGETYLGLPGQEPKRWALQSNTALAGNLRGKLLLVHGELDDDTHPANSLQVADALIQAGKEFDLLIVPRMNHGGLSSSALYRRKLWDYFVRHLLGLEPPDWNRVSFAALLDEVAA
jgi:dipeptidyl aminopeptidase/acylaminoacyl peptidase